MNQIYRQWDIDTSVAVGATAAASDEVDIRQFVGGSVEVPNGSTLTAITFYASISPGGTHLPLLDDAHAAVTLTVAADEVCTLPAEVNNVPFFKMVGDNAETVKVFLKA